MDLGDACTILFVLTAFCNLTDVAVISSVIFIYALLRTRGSLTRNDTARCTD